MYSLSQQSNLHENFKSIHSMQSQWFRSKIEDFFKYAGSFHFNRAFTLNAQFYRLKFNGKFGRSNDTKKTSKALEFAFIFMRTWRNSSELTKPYLENNDSRNFQANQFINCYSNGNTQFEFWLISNVDESIQRLSQNVHHSKYLLISGNKTVYAWIAIDCDVQVFCPEFGSFPRDRDSLCIITVFIAFKWNHKMAVAVAEVAVSTSSASNLFALQPKTEKHGRMFANSFLGDY